MRREVGKAVRRHFNDVIGRCLSCFVEMRDVEIPDGDRVYAWQLVPDLAFYLALIIDHRWDAFTIEVAWSRDAKWPAYALLGMPTDHADMMARLRIASLWGSKRDFWWHLSREFSLDEIEEATRTLSDLNEPLELVLPRVEPMVDDAVSRIIDFALPYFEQTACRFGLRNAWQEQMTRGQLGKTDSGERREGRY